MQPSEVFLAASALSLLRGSRGSDNAHWAEGKKIRVMFTETGMNSEVIEKASFGRGDDPGAASSQPEVSSIPFEFVDDEEMAAIEKALLHAHSLSSAFHSIEQATFLSTTVPGNSLVADSSPKLRPCVMKKAKNSFVYTVSTDSFCISSSAAASVNDVSSSSHSAACDEGISSQTRNEALNSGDCQFPAVVESDESLTSDGRREELREREGVGGRGSEGAQDMEDILGTSSKGVGGHLVTGGRRKMNLLQRKSRRGLSVTDFTAAEWCEKQVEFSLNRGKPEQTPVMKAGCVRHAELEKEVVTRVDVEITTREDSWGIRLMNFISGARQLLREGLTRELPVLGVVEGTWVVGIIDEIRLVEMEFGEKPMIVDTKTRKRPVPPAEPQKRNARLQLMCYKVLWDSMIQTGIPADSFFRHFRLDPQQNFCRDVVSYASSLWEDCDVQCLQDVLLQMKKDVSSKLHSRSVDTLLLRYEWQEDRSLLGEDRFLYEHEWLMDRWHWHLQFWSGSREASFVPDDEVWKCRYCPFANVCLPAQ